FFSSRRRHTIFSRDWSSDVCSSDLSAEPANSNTAPLSHAFLRWVYLWRIVMQPLGAHIPTPLTFLCYAARRRQTRTHTTSQHARSEERRVGKRRRPAWPR